MALQVTVRHGDAREEFPCADLVSIGRGAENDIVLRDPLVSRQHARFSYRDGASFVVDLGSGNGTRVAGRELAPRVETALQPGSEVSIGAYIVSVRWLADFHEPARQGGATVLVGRDRRTVIAAIGPSLSVTIDGGGSSSFALKGPAVTIGRDPGCDVVIESPLVSRHHMTLRQEGAGYAIAEVTGQNGVNLDGVSISAPFVLPAEAWLDIGGAVLLGYASAPGGQGEMAAEGEVRARLGAGKLIIGRTVMADLVIDHPLISRRHARLVATPAGHTLEDLESSNGTWVNGLRLEPGVPQAVRAGDAIQVGPISLVLSEDEIRPQSSSNAISLDAIGLEKRVNAQTNLLQHISLAIRPHEFVAIVGVSGAGKTTLAGALSGMAPATGGTVLVNGMPLYENWGAFRTALGFVPQDDILHKELTVERALGYSAALRLPSDTTSEERAARVDAVIETLGLQERRKVPIARLSGGQRKRVSIGAELLTEPGLFFLDEATSGLDPGTEVLMMRLLRKIADEGRTVILITHATKNVMLCDHVVFLAKGGHLAFFGPPDQALKAFEVDDFDGIYQRIDGELTPAEWAEIYRRSPQHAALVEGRLAGAGTSPARAAPIAPKQDPTRARPVHPISAIKQLWILSRRYLEITCRDRALLLILALISPAIGIVDFVATKRDVLDPVGGNSTKALTFLFLSALFPFMVGLLGSVREIVKESVIYQRERSVALSVTPYIGSKVVVALLFALYHAVMLTGIKVLAVEMPGVGLQGFAMLYVTSALAVLSGTVTGLTISTFARREEQAMILAVAAIIMQIVFSGALISLADLGPSGVGVGYITSTHWGFKADTAAVGLTFEKCSQLSLVECDLPGFRALADEPARQVTFKPLREGWGDIFDADIFVCWGAMLAIMSFLGVVTVIRQRMKDTL